MRASRVHGKHGPGHARASRTFRPRGVCVVPFPLPHPPHGARDDSRLPNDERPTQVAYPMSGSAGLGVVEVAVDTEVDDLAVWKKPSSRSVVMLPEGARKLA